MPEQTVYTPREDSAGNLLVDQRLLLLALRWAEQLGEDDRGVPMTRFKSALRLPSKAHSVQLVDALRLFRIGAFGVSSLVLTLVFFALMFGVVSGAESAGFGFSLILVVLGGLSLFAWTVYRIAKGWMRLAEGRIVQ